MNKVEIKEYLKKHLSIELFGEQEYNGFGGYRDVLVVSLIIDGEEVSTDSVPLPLGDE